MGAAAAGTYTTRGTPTATNIREDLADVIYRIDPDEVPVVSAMDRVGADQVLTEWLVQELNAAGKNAQAEGFEATYAAATPPARLSNICQILSRTVSVANSFRASNTVGGEDEFDRQRLLRGMEVKRDLEWTILNPQVAKTTDPREMASLEAYISNGSAGSGTGAMPVGTGASVHVVGTLRALTMTLVASAMEQAYMDGGQPSLGVMSPTLKRAFSALAAGGSAGAAQNILSSTKPEPVTVVGAVDVYRTDFGPIEMVPDRFCGANTVFLIDPDYVELAPLPGRDMITAEYATTGDAKKGGVVFEGTLRVTAPKAHAAVFDVIP
jgi:hypothetical protein